MVGSLAAAILLVNNLRDIPGDIVASKMTLAVRLGDRRTRLLYTALVALPFLLLPFAAGLSGRFGGALAFAAIPVAFRPTLRGADRGSGHRPDPRAGRNSHGATGLRAALRRRGRAARMKPWMVVIFAGLTLVAGAVVGTVRGDGSAPEVAASQAESTTTTTIAPPSAFYTEVTADELTADTAPGHVLAQAPATGMPEGAVGTRVLYRSSNAAGEPIVASGLVMVPDSHAPAEGYPVIVWGHSTVGLADGCTPSLDGPPPGLDSATVLAAGYVIVAPDFEGLGTPEVHAYLDGLSAARTMLDAARAARQLDGAAATGAIALWGLQPGRPRGGAGGPGTPELRT